MGSNVIFWAVDLSFIAAPCNLLPFCIVCRAKTQNIQGLADTFKFPILYHNKMKAPSVCCPWAALQEYIHVTRSFRDEWRIEGLKAKVKVTSQHPAVSQD